MAELHVEIEGRSYPFRQTMGAALLFKRTTGREASVLSEGNLSDIVTWLWCCVRSASRHDGIDFSLDLEAFADAIDADDVQRLTADLTAGGAAPGEASKNPVGAPA